MKMKVILCIAALCAVQSSVFALGTEELKKIDIGMSKAEVHDAFGEPERVSIDKSKETYTLSDGSRAVLNFADDVFRYGFRILY